MSAPGGAARVEPGREQGPTGAMMSIACRTSARPSDGESLSRPDQTCMTILVGHSLFSMKRAISR